MLEHCGGGIVACSGCDAYLDEKKGHRKCLEHIFCDDPKSNETFPVAFCGG